MKNNISSNNASSDNKEEILLKMMKAKKVNQSEIINFIRNTCLDLNKIDSHGYNLLHYAIKLELCDIVNTFLTLDDNFITLKADPNIETLDQTNSILLNPLLLALIHCNDSTNSGKIIKSLIRAGADSLCKDETGCSFLLKVCEKGRLDILGYLENKSTEEKPINWNETSKNGGPLQMAILGDQEDLISYLLEKKIDLSILDVNQNTALHLSLQLKNFNVFKTISDFIKTSNDLKEDQKKAIMSAINDEGNTILHELAYAQSSVLTDYIVKNNNIFGVDLNLKNKQNYTYLEVQKNIIQIKKDKEEMEKKKREMIRQEKERVAAEKKKEDELRRQLDEKEFEEEEKRQQFRLKILSYRNYIFLTVFVLFMVVLYFLLDSKIKNKKKAILI